MNKPGIQMRKYGFLYVYGVVLAILLAFLFIAGCKGIQGGVIGGGVGAATGTPQGVGVGAAAGFVVGLWNDITTAVSNWWDSLWGHAAQVPAAGSSPRIWTWLILLALFGFLVKFLYHYGFDAEFRRSVHLMLKPKLKRKLI